jgi:hypothetical protein
MFALIRPFVFIFVALEGLNVEHRTSNVDGFVKSLKTSFSVFPAEAGIQYFHIVLDACLRGNDNKAINIE